MKNDVAFVLLTHNDHEDAILAIESIQKIKTKAKISVFVVDNASSSDVSSIIIKKFPKVTVIKLKKNIGTAAYDEAIKKTNAEYVYFTGSDVLFEKDMLDPLIKALENDEKVALANPKGLTFDKKNIESGGTWLSRSFYSGKFKDNTLGNKNREIPYRGTGLIRRSVIDGWGYLFDPEYFFYGEDVDLGLRLKLQGYKTVYVPSSIFYHKGSVSRKKFSGMKLTYLMERNLIRTFFTTLSFPRILLYFPYVVLMRFVAMAFDLLKLHFGVIFSRIGGLFWVLLHLGIILKKRSQVQKRRKVSDSEVVKVFCERYLVRR